MTAQHAAHSTQKQKKKHFTFERKRNRCGEVRTRQSGRKWLKADAEKGGATTTEEAMVAARVYARPIMKRRRGGGEANAGRKRRPFRNTSSTAALLTQHRAAGRSGRRAGHRRETSCAGGRLPLRGRRVAGFFAAPPDHRARAFGWQQRTCKCAWWTLQRSIRDQLR